MLTGCSAGFLNVAEIKGTHHAMKSGMVAAETIFSAMEKNDDISGMELTDYQKSMNNSWVMSDLK
jgi:electron-transferring-flavoprotein dehydrogenase